MKTFLWVIWAALRATFWKSTAAGRPVGIGMVLLFAVLAAASEAANQYLTAEGAAGFSPYGINSIIAGIAVGAVVTLLFASRHRTVVLARFLAMSALVSWLAAVVVHYLPFKPQDFPPGACPVVILLLVTWWIGSAVAVLRGAGVGPYQSATIRGFGLAVVSLLAVTAMPSFPTFAGRDFELSTYNFWEIASAKFRKGVEETTAEVDTAAIELSQPSLLEAEIGKLLPERKGTTDIYAIGIAGWSDQDVFTRELNGGLSILSRSLGMDRGTVRLVNHRDTLATTPVATRTNFAAAVRAVARTMNKDEDVMVIFITSHGGPTGVGLFLGSALTAVLSPDHVASVLDREGIRNRVIIVSACYSGVFVKALASPDSIVLTAADENSTSFGCSNEREWTYFGDAFFNQSFGESVSLQQAFEDAKVKISEWEARDALPPSSPQGHFGAVISEKLAKLKSGKKMQASTEER
ncbi:C13 family peptidase [Bradyrhizobium sp.]|uniref:C13 family peptidase n=1 Tax=Bradyrhizobium sp. TaxID=376 RepID=UPI002BD75E3E|nr:C13 family peptidase [Bradyrhizobium sp.]HMM93318.1 C13 family peptidase [Bradyrhizobium sp.]